jgi:ABC-type ATPase with predicted acetyltransferase domain
MMPIHWPRYSMHEYKCPACGKTTRAEIAPECPRDGTRMIEAPRKK